MRIFPQNVKYVKTNIPTPKEENGLLHISSNTLKELSKLCFHEISFFLRSSHLEQISKIQKSSSTPENEKFATTQFLKNAIIASNEILPLCQDTGTAIVIGNKGNTIITDGTDEEALSEGIKETYLTDNLRYSQNIPTNTFIESNSNNNLPACIDISAVKSNEYQFLMIAKGGGSANKTYLFQETRALLNHQKLIGFLKAKIKTLGTAACPPYHLAIVIGGLSAEQNLKAVKLASAKALDELPSTNEGLRDKELENEILQVANEIGYGAQFGGNNYCLDVRVIRLPRHGASLPIGIGISCIADRNILAKIDKTGVYIEELEHNPSKFLSEIDTTNLSNDEVEINLDQPIKEICNQLHNYPVGTRISLSGTLIVARDIAHAKFKELLDNNKPLPEYLFKHPIYYAGPAKTPINYPSGSFGPTTAGRMDTYVDLLQQKGASLIMLAKGNRSDIVLNSCKNHKGFYLGTLGGVAALVATQITKKECIDYPELGMEAVYKIKVKNLSAFILIDDKGNDFFKKF
ncbi:MAG: FumA C-terminus/TtdB family hydratase beta subunit [Alphaproteobacteria bacterium]|nr:FumA C-terminus/TtdB family hydratase beta subunit [Alphaproteobacteria bacterium]